VIDQSEVAGKRLVKTFFDPDDYDRIAERAQHDGRAIANWLRHAALAQLAIESQP
jgi:hypothetical protein